MAGANTIDLSGNNVIVSSIGLNSDAPGSGATNAIRVYAGSGAPTLTATKGSLYSRTDGSSTSTRLYVNTDGGTTWTNFTSAA